MRGMAETLVHSRQGCGVGLRALAQEPSGHGPGRQGAEMSVLAVLGTTVSSPHPPGDQCINTSISCRSRQQINHGGKSREISRVCLSVGEHTTREQVFPSFQSPTLSLRERHNASKKTVGIRKVTQSASDTSASVLSTLKVPFLPRRAASSRPTHS